MLGQLAIGAPLTAKLRLQSLMLSSMEVIRVLRVGPQVAMVVVLDKERLVRCFHLTARRKYLCCKRCWLRRKVRQPCKQRQRAGGGGSCRTVHVAAKV